MRLCTYLLCMCVHVYVLCMCMCCDVHACLHVRVHTCMWGSQKLSISLVLWYLGSPTEPEAGSGACRLANLASQPVLGVPCLCLSGAGMTDLLPRVCGFCTGSVDPNSDRHTCVPSALATEIPSALQLAFFLGKRSQYTSVDLMLKCASPKCMERDCQLQKRGLVSAGLRTGVSEMFLAGKGGRL